ncbi:MAG: 1-acyl-sn-glycerol-3-phosphate acyltransferase [Deltaproteobacteria bacterium]|nr:1-acyl-sn-glycerol-3-phosphate acyltransferase [Deltaproteobacteria bacterium]
MISLPRLHMLARFGACTVCAGMHSTLIPLPLTLALTRRFERERLLARIHAMQPWAHFCRKHILRIDLDLRGREHLPQPSRGHMFICNHQSYVDILVLMEALDTVAFLSKKLVLYLPFIGQCAYAGGTVFLDRKKNGSRKRALNETLRMCRDSTGVVVFPEGTRSADGSLRREIKAGSMAAAWKQGLSVVPVGLDGTYRVLPKAMDRVGLDQPVAVEIGEVVHPSDFPDADSWVADVWERVIELHHRCRQRVEARR